MQFHQSYFGCNLILYQLFILKHALEKKHCVCLHLRLVQINEEEHMDNPLRKPI